MDIAKLLTRMSEGKWTFEWSPEADCSPFTERHCVWLCGLLTTRGEVHRRHRHHQCGDWQSTVPSTRLCERVVHCLTSPVYCVQWQLVVFSKVVLRVTRPRIRLRVIHPFITSRFHCFKQFFIYPLTIQLSCNLFTPLLNDLLTYTFTHIQLYKYTMMCQSNTTKFYYVYYCTRATCFDSYRIIFRAF